MKKKHRDRQTIEARERERERRFRFGIWVKKERERKSTSRKRQTGRLIKSLLFPFVTQMRVPKTGTKKQLYVHDTTSDPFSWVCVCVTGVCVLCVQECVCLFAFCVSCPVRVEWKSKRETSTDTNHTVDQLHLSFQWQFFVWQKGRVKFALSLSLSTSDEDRTFVLFCSLSLSLSLVVHFAPVSINRYFTHSTWSTFLYCGRETLTGLFRQ